uniref:Signal peptide protein n=1 Tax=Heterorhabditis bacteriophora TaxID=37862 RepID=A0A1I7X2E6_HETBA
MLNLPENIHFSDNQGTTALNLEIVRKYIYTCTSQILKKWHRAEIREKSSRLTFSPKVFRLNLNSTHLFNITRPHVLLSQMSSASLNQISHILRNQFHATHVCSVHVCDFQKNFTSLRILIWIFGGRTKNARLQFLSIRCFSCHGKNSSESDVINLINLSLKSKEKSCKYYKTNIDELAFISFLRQHRDIWFFASFNIDVTLCDIHNSHLNMSRWNKCSYSMEYIKVRRMSAIYHKSTTDDKRLGQSPLTFSVCRHVWKWKGRNGATKLVESELGLLYIVASRIKGLIVHSGAPDFTRDGFRISVTFRIFWMFFLSQCSCKTVGLSMDTVTVFVFICFLLPPFCWLFLSAILYRFESLFHQPLILFRGQYETTKYPAAAYVGWSVVEKNKATKIGGLTYQMKLKKHSKTTKAYVKQAVKKNRKKHAEVRDRTTAASPATRRHDSYIIRLLLLNRPSTEDILCRKVSFIYLLLLIVWLISIGNSSLYKLMKEMAKFSLSAIRKKISSLPGIEERNFPHKSSKSSVDSFMDMNAANIFPTGFNLYFPQYDSTRNILETTMIYSLDSRHERGPSATSLLPLFLIFALFLHFISPLFLCLTTNFSSTLSIPAKCCYFMVSFLKQFVINCCNLLSCCCWLFLLSYCANKFPTRIIFILKCTKPLIYWGKMLTCTDIPFMHLLRKHCLCYLCSYHNFFLKCLYECLISILLALSTLRIFPMLLYSQLKLGYCTEHFVNINIRSNFLLRTLEYSRFYVSGLFRYGCFCYYGRYYLDKNNTSEILFCNILKIWINNIGNGYIYELILRKKIDISFM